MDSAKSIKSYFLKKLGKPFLKVVLKLKKVVAHKIRKSGQVVLLKYFNMQIVIFVMED